MDRPVGKTNGETTKAVAKGGQYRVRQGRELGADTKKGNEPYLLGVTIFSKPLSNKKYSENDGW